MVLLLAFSLQDQVEKYGAYVGIAAFFGLAVLTLLYFAQAREVKRLREWAGRAPERAREVEERAIAQAEAARPRSPRRAGVRRPSRVAAATAAGGRSGTVEPGRAGRRRRDRRWRSARGRGGGRGAEPPVEGPVTADGKQPVVAIGPRRRRAAEEDEERRRARAPTSERRPRDEAEDADADGDAEARARRGPARRRGPADQRRPAAGRRSRPRPAPGTAAGVAERAPARRRARRRAAAPTPSRRPARRAPRPPRRRRDARCARRSAAAPTAVRLAAPPGTDAAAAPARAAPGAAPSGGGTPALVRDRRRCRRGRRRARRARRHAAPRRRRGDARAQPGRDADAGGDRERGAGGGGGGGGAPRPRAAPTRPSRSSTARRSTGSPPAPPTSSRRAATSAAPPATTRTSSAPPRRSSTRARHAARRARSAASSTSPSCARWTPRRRRWPARAPTSRSSSAATRRPRPPALSQARPRRLRAARGGDVRGVLRRPAPQGRRVGGGDHAAHALLLAQRRRPPRRQPDHLQGQGGRRGRRSTIVDRDGERVRRVASGIDGAPGPARARSSGTGATDGGARAPDGRYRMRVGPAAQRPHGPSRARSRRHRRRRRRSCVASTPPIAGPVPGAFEIRARGVGRAARRASACCAPTSSPVREVARFTRPRGQPPRRLGRRVGGAPAPPGTYMVVVGGPRPRRQRGHRARRAAAGRRARSAAGRASPCARSPPSRRSSRCAPGERVEFFVDSRRRSYRWSVRRVGAARPVKRAARRAGPRRSPCARRDGVSGAYLLEVRSGRYSARVPFLVQAPERARLLVVVPAITWLGVDQVDDDGDGLPNTLETGGPVKWPRVIAGDQGCRRRSPTRPRRCSSSSTARASATTSPPTSRWRARATRARPTARASCWPARCAGSRARSRGGCARYVEDGGRLASFGTESLRRGVRVGGEPPVAPDPADADRPVRRPPGADRRPAPARTATPLPLTALADDAALGLLTGSDGVLDAFGRLEESAARPGRAAARCVDRARAGRHRRRARRGRGRGRAAARGAARADRGAARQGGRDPRRADRVGQRAGTDREVGQITRNIVDVLRRRQAARRAPRAAEDPELRHPQRRRRERGRWARRTSAPRAPARPRGARRARRSPSGLAVPELGASGGGRAARRRGRTGAGGRSRRRRARRAAASACAWPIARPAATAAGMRPTACARVDGDRAGGAQQLARLRLEIEALEPLGEQQNEELLFHRSLTL